MINIFNKLISANSYKLKIFKVENEVLAVV